MPKSSASEKNTVFVRLVPPSAAVNRHHLEEYFSQIGPVKKCSVISSKDKNKKGLGYGFVRFVSQEDAQEAAKKCNQQELRVDNQSFKLIVELASRNRQEEQQNKHKKKPNRNPAKQVENDGGVGDTKDGDTQKEVPVGEDNELLQQQKRKRTSRVIVRNLSFYANEHHVKSAMEERFGPVVDVHIPRVNPQLHRGFAFVTFASAKDANQAIQPTKEGLEIKKRRVAIDYCVSKNVHQQQQQQQRQQQQEDEDEDEEESDSDDDDDSQGDDEKLSDDDDDDGSSDDEEGSESEAEEEDEEDQEDDESQSITKRESEQWPEGVVDKGVESQRTVFIRNLPFDATRQDVFELMRRFGYVETIVFVKDRETGVFKGTAFCSFRKAEDANKVLEEAGEGSSGFQAQRDQNSAVSFNDGLTLRGRRLYCDLAVDKQTASTLTMEKSEEGRRTTGRDKRNIYLTNEGRVPSEADEQNSAIKHNHNHGGEKDWWENLPASDQQKRQRAFAEKSTKLRSPLFFINPTRLSIRNLAKHVDEAMLKKLCERAVQRGLERSLVRQDDQVAHWRAGGDMTTRDIMKRIQQAKDEGRGDVLPGFDPKNVKKFIPSVYIDREFASPEGGKKNKNAPSRGFGFVDFAHHAHAMACLRELNNNAKYSVEYATGGRRAAEVKRLHSKRKRGQMSQGEFVSEDGKALTPRLIVDFTVSSQSQNSRIFVLVVFFLTF